MKRIISGILLTVILVAADQISKIAIIKNVRFHQGIEVLGNFLRITHVRNPGGAFSTKFGSSTFYIIVAGVASLFVIAYLIKSMDGRRSLRIALFMILAGAFGNMIDRIRFAEVIDWIDIGIGATRWPTFNIADSAIVIGLIILIFAGSMDERKKVKDNGSAGDSPDVA